MARFRATIQGNRGAASRLGTGKSGLQASINGWHAGITVSAWAHGDIDIFEVRENGGSTGARASTALATVQDGKIILGARTTELERTMRDVLAKIQTAWTAGIDARSRYAHEVRRALRLCDLADKEQP